MKIAQRNTSRSRMRTLYIVVIPLLFLSSCSSCFLGPDKPLIRWENFDFDEGLGKPTVGLPKGFIGTPIEGGVAIRDFWIKNKGTSKTVWGISNAVVRSDDMGNSWRIIEDSMKPEALGFEGPNCICIDSYDHIWVATAQRIFRSTNDGASWNRVYEGPPDIHCVGYNSMRVKGSTLWLATSEGVLLTIRTDSLLASEACRMNRIIYDVLPASNGLTYIGTSEQMMVSSDSGRTFTVHSDVSNARDLLEINGTFFCISDGMIVQVGANGVVLWDSIPYYQNDFMSLCGKDGIVYALNNDPSGAFLVRIDSTRGNATTRIDLGGLAEGGGDAYIDEEGQLFVGLSGRVLTSVDGGGSWNEQLFGLSTVNVITSLGGSTWAGLNGNGAAIFHPESGYWETIGTRLERGLSWTIWTIHMLSSDNTILGGGPEAELALTSDGGNTFEFIWFDSSNASFTAQNVARNSTDSLFSLFVRYDPISEAHSAPIYRSNDFGETWSFVSVICQNEFRPPWGTLVIDESRNCMWAALDGGFYKGSISGTDWQRVSYPVFDQCKGNAFLDRARELYVCGSNPSGNGIHRLDTNDNWHFIDLPYSPDYRPNGFIVDADGYYWLCSELGLYYSQNEGTTWIAFTKEEGLASDVVNSIFVEGQGDEKVLWVGTALGASRGTFIQ